MTRKLAFETQPYKGITIRAFYCDDEGKPVDSDIEIVRDGVVIQAYTYPGYKIWNIAAHAEDIIDQGHDGWMRAGWTEFGVYVMPQAKDGVA